MNYRVPASAGDLTLSSGPEFAPPIEPTPAQSVGRFLMSPLVLGVIGLALVLDWKRKKGLFS